MARYIDADALVDDFEHRLVTSNIMSPDIEVLDVLEIIENTPTADVVPRSEVEKAKQEVAREIFEEIVKLLIFNTYEIACISKTDLTELKKKYIGE